MPFSFVRGSFWDHNPTVVVNTANCVGAMGAGVAKSISERWPAVGREFRTLCGTGLNCDGMPDSRYSGSKYSQCPPCIESGCACDVHQIRPGSIKFVRTHDPIIPWVAHFPTKRHWNSPARLDDIASNLIALADALASGRQNIAQTVVLPAPGCANGGLSWSDVKPLIEQHLKPRAESSIHRVLSFEPMARR